MGELHLDIIVDRLRREFKVEVNQGKPQVEYKEAITKVANHREVYKKQSGGRGNRITSYNVCYTKLLRSNTVSVTRCSSRST